MDYGMPRADDMSPVDFRFASIPTKTNPLGVKGGSEAGNIAAPPSHRERDHRRTGIPGAP
jgi:carbon-monoxide dehydrogenase large subunit